MVIKILTISSALIIYPYYADIHVCMCVCICVVSVSNCDTQEVIYAYAVHHKLS